MIDDHNEETPSTVTSGEYITDVNGKVPLITGTVSPKIHYDRTLYYHSTIKFDAEATGYYSSNGKNTLTFGSTPRDYSRDSKEVADAMAAYEKRTVTDVNIVLIKPTDYLDTKFLNDNKNLSGKTLAFLEDIKIKGYLGDSILKYHSIDLSNFKNNKYLAFTFENTNVYNSIKLNKYDIAKQLFDEVIRKVLSPLNDFVSDNTFYGYDITVIGHTKNFVEDKYGKGTAIQYRFILPQSAVKAYKDKDISGQQLIDKSIVLMEDERIDLKLQ